MAIAPDPLAADRDRRRLDYEASYRARDELMANPELLAELRARADELANDPSTALTTRDEFVRRYGPDGPQPT
jgi:hypothetical protein